MRSRSLWFVIVLYLILFFSSAAPAQSIWKIEKNKHNRQWEWKIDGEVLAKEGSSAGASASESGRYVTPPFKVDMKDGTQRAAAFVFSGYGTERSKRLLFDLKKRVTDERLFTYLPTFDADLSALRKITYVLSPDGRQAVFRLPKMREQKVFGVDVVRGAIRSNGFKFSKIFRYIDVWGRDRVILGASHDKNHKVHLYDFNGKEKTYFKMPEKAGSIFKNRFHLLRNKKILYYADSGIYFLQPPGDMSFYQSEIKALKQYAWPSDSHRIRRLSKNIGVIPNAFGNRYVLAHVESRSFPSRPEEAVFMLFDMNGNVLGMTQLKGEWITVRRVVTTQTFMLAVVSFTKKDGTRGDHFLIYDINNRTLKKRVTFPLSGIFHSMIDLGNDNFALLMDDIYRSGESNLYIYNFNFKRLKLISQFKLPGHVKLSLRKLHDGRLLFGTNAARKKLPSYLLIADPLTGKSLKLQLNEKMYLENSLLEMKDGTLLFRTNGARNYYIVSLRHSKLPLSIDLKSENMERRFRRSFLYGVLQTMNDYVYHLSRLTRSKHVKSSDIQWRRKLLAYTDLRRKQLVELSKRLLGHRGAKCVRRGLNLSRFAHELRNHNDLFPTWLDVSKDRLVIYPYDPRDEKLDPTFNMSRSIRRVLAEGLSNEFGPEMGRLIQYVTYYSPEARKKDGPVLARLWDNVRVVAQLGKFDEVRSMASLGAKTCESANKMKQNKLWLWIHDHPEKFGQLVKLIENFIK